MKLTNKFSKRHIRNAALFIVTLSLQIPLFQNFTTAAMPRLVSAVSRKAHGTVASFDLQLNLDNSNPTIDPMTTANKALHSIVLNFDRPVAMGNVSALSGNANVYPLYFFGNQMFILLTGVSNAQYVTLSYSNVRYSDADVGASGHVTIGFLQGDVDSSRDVKMADLSLINSQMLQPISYANFKYDINSDGIIDRTDFLIAYSATVAPMLPSYPASKGGRLIGMNIFNETPFSKFVDNVSYAKSVGTSYITLNMGWNAFEANAPNDCESPGNFVDPGNLLSILNSYLPSVNLKMSLDLDPISTNMNQMPGNLSGRPLNDPLVICRYKKLLVYVLSKIPNIELVSMQFGNEIDAYPAAVGADYWTQYKEFYMNVSPVAKTLRPGLKTSITATMFGVLGTENPTISGGIRQIFNLADMAVITYYPMYSDFTAKPPTSVSSDIGRLISLYPNKPIYFNEIGYDSGSKYIQSSLEMQRQFMQQAFATWDKYPAQIQSMAFFRLNDASPEQTQMDVNMFGLAGNDKFYEYLQTLGLRNYWGQDKPAFKQMKLETIRRGW